MMSFSDRYDCAFFLSRIDSAIPCTIAKRMPNTAIRRVQRPSWDCLILRVHSSSSDRLKFENILKVGYVGLG